MGAACLLYPLKLRTGSTWVESGSSCSSPWPRGGCSGCQVGHPVPFIGWPWRSRLSKGLVTLSQGGLGFFGFFLVSGLLKFNFTLFKCTALWFLTSSYSHMTTLKIQNRTSLMVQWLRLHAANTEGAGLSPGWETKIPRGLWHNRKIYKINKIFFKRYTNFPCAPLLATPAPGNHWWVICHFAFSRMSYKWHHALCVSLVLTSFTQLLRLIHVVNQYQEFIS